LGKNKKMKAFKLITLIGLIVLISGFGCVKDEELKTEFNIEALNIGDGWQVSSLASEGFNEETFRVTIMPLFDENNYITVTSMVVVRNGKLVAEAYMRDFQGRYQKRQIQSATKCITSLVIGIALEKNYFTDLDQKLYSIIPEAFDEDARKREITLRHLLTMNSGLKFNNEEIAEELFMKKQENVNKYILTKPLFALPGSGFNYRDCDPQLLSGAIHKQTGLPLDLIANKYLFKPLGITDYFWERNADGDSWASEALFMRPRDMAKIGQLVLNKGKWNGDQLVPEEWIDRSTSTQSDPNAGQPADKRVTFGYYWRIQPGGVAIEANGAGGQQILIIPEKNLVIVYTCEPYVQSQYSLETALYNITNSIINSMTN
jgi:CubicO group peptidase (beta-lactamase class C family)